jgi:GNAT superfamily N-acetyltransferase
MSIHEWRKDGYTASTDPARLDLGVVHGFLSREAYWSPGIARDLVESAIRGSLTIGLYDPGGAQVGFARIITDATLFAYLRDVFVLAPHRGKGLGLWLAELAIAHPDLAGVRKWMLSTSDAHSLYARLGFQPLSQPEVYMQLQR